MIYTSIKYLRIGSVILGFLLVILSFFLPYYSSCEWNANESGTIEFFKYGYETRMFYVQCLFVIALFFSGYFYQNLINKILLYILSFILLVSFFLVRNAPNRGATPCVRSPEIGQDLSLYGSLLVLLGTFISIYREAE